MDANRYIEPAGHLSRDEHFDIEVIYRFLAQTGRIDRYLKELLRDRVSLLNAFATRDATRLEGKPEVFRVFVFGTYDAELLLPVDAGEFPACPCGKSTNGAKTPVRCPVLSI